MKFFDRLKAFFGFKKEILRCDGCGIKMDYDSDLRFVGGVRIETIVNNFESNKRIRCYNCYRFILLNNKINHLMGIPPTNKGP